MFADKSGGSCQYKRWSFFAHDVKLVNLFQ
jgi:hypothetical protein